MRVLHGVDQPTDGFQQVLLHAVRGAPRRTGAGSLAAHLIAEQEHVERFARELWVQAWAAGAAWMSARSPRTMIFYDTAMKQQVEQLLADREQRQAQGDEPQP